MHKPLLTIKETEDFLKNDPLIRQYLSDLINRSIQEKKTSFLKTNYEKEYEYLQPFKLISRESDKIFLLNYSHLATCFVLTEIAEKIMKEKVPAEPVQVLGFANRFAEEIRKPTVRTWWYGDMELHLHAYLLIYLHQVYGIDITAFVQSITNEMKDTMVELRSTDTNYKHVFPYLNDTTEQLFVAISAMLTSERTKHSALEALSDIGKINPDKAAALYKYSKENNAISQASFLPQLLNGLYPADEPFYMNEAVALFELNPIEALHAFTWFAYSKADQIKVAFDFLASKDIKDIEYLRNATTFYIRLIDNKLTPEDIRQQCFRMIGEFAKQEDPQLRSNLVWRTGMIEGHDKEKYALLPAFIAWGKPHFLKEYFNYFSSPSSLFDLISQSFLHHGMSVEMDYFNDALYSQYHKNKPAFSQELLNLLSNDIAILRFAGIRVMMSAHGGMYEANFLELDEKHQIRIIETLLPLPTNIEELMPLILTLRKSSHDSVKKKLESGLIDLIRAYDHHLIDMMEQHLDKADDTDKTLLQSLQSAYEIYKEEKQTKLKIKELSPVNNELEYLELFYRLEHEKQAEMMEQIQSKSFFAQMAKNITVIRGSGFSSETNPDISIMGEVGSSRLIDQRYSINPDSYEWNFRMNATLKNYEDKKEE